MQAKSVRDLGALARAARRERGMTQADLARRLGVSRDWVVRLEQGHPRLEAQRVLDALTVLGLALEVGPPTAVRRESPGPTVEPSRATADPFDVLFEDR